MKNYTARIIVNGVYTYRRLTASSLDAAIELFRSQLLPNETLVQVKGNTIDGRYTEISKVFV